MKKGEVEKPKKKHRLLKLIGILFLILLLFSLIGTFIEDENYKEIETQNETTKLVEKLASGGDPLTDSYDGAYGLWGVEQKQSGLRDYYVQAEKAQNATLMVYMIGSDLESEGGAATGDLQEMIDSGNNENLNIVVQTGGASNWQNEAVSSDARQRWLIQNQEMALVDEMEQGSMCNKDSVRDFITWSAKTYPADRYIFVFWDHGGGTMGGYGYDENYPDDTLTLSDMVSAVAESQIQLDVMSYDACLMGTLEVGYAFEPYADYLLASEETEPGEGWYYTDTLAALSENPSMSTVEYGARMIDGFGEYYGNQDVTLSLMDLREAPALYESSSNYYQSSLNTLTETTEAFSQMSNARSNCRNYGEGECEQIDLVDYVQRTNVEHAQDIVKAAFSMVKYRNDSSLTGSYGTAVYFPYSSPESYQSVRNELDKIQYQASEGFYDEFLSVLAGGTSGNADATEQLTGYENEQQTQTEETVQQEEWYNEEASEEYDYQVIQDQEELILDEKDGEYSLSLSDEVWNSIVDIQLQVMIDDGEGYIDLGSDQIFEWNEDDSLRMDFDNYWTSINGNLAAYYACEIQETDNQTVFIGKTPAILNGENTVDLYIQTKQDADENNEMSILGYIPTDTSDSTVPKGYLPLKKGDEIQLLCDYYTYDGEFDDSYVLGDPFMVDTQEGLEVGEYDLEEMTSICCYQLTDIYQQNWYTEVIEFTYE